MPDEPELKWISDAVPQSVRFNDTYYAQDDGRAESRYVFIEGNGLPDRWAHMESLLIGELGFGTGLNFLETVRQFQIADPEQSRKLLFYSFEKYPLKPHQMAKALSRWPDIAALSADWFKNWDLKPGLNCFTRNNICLTLAVGDATSLLPECEDLFDAWYLDGFNPKNNETMWTERLMRHVFERTRSSGTFATYTAAGWVRRNLEAAGFKVEKRQGYGNKREMMIGRREEDRRLNECG